MTCSPDNFRDRPKRIEKQNPLRKERNRNIRIRKLQRKREKEWGEEYQTTMKEYFK